jgi:hypothetical protein
MENMAQGGIFLLPFRIVWMGMRGMGWLISIVVANVREILNPSFTSEDPRSSYASYEVAERKICRMRKPIYMAALQTRANFDPEYLGIPMAGAGTQAMDALFRQDLDRIGCLAEEREELEGLCRERRARHRRLLTRLVERGILVNGAVVSDAGAGGLEAPSAAAMRALTTAYLIDYQNAASLIEGGRDVTRVFDQALKDGGKLTESHGDLAGQGAEHGWFARLRFMTRRRSKGDFESWWNASSYAGRPDDEKQLCFEAWIEDRGGVRNLIRLMNRSGGQEQAEAAGWKIVSAAARRPGAWSEQLITLRTVQTLTILDLECYRRIVRRLGAYEETA